MLAPIDFIIIAVYLLMSVGVGIACRGRQQSVDDYFTAAGGMRGLFSSILIGLSIARMRLGREMTTRQQLAYARIVSLIIGVVSTLFAGVVSQLGPIFEASQTVLGVFLGPLLGCVGLAVMRSRVNPSMMLIGMIAGVVVGWVLALPWVPIYPLWIAPFTFATTCCIAVVGTWISGAVPASGKSPQAAEAVV